MSYPILYAPTKTDFDNNGIGILSDAMSCMVTEEANGEFELEMEYPITGIHYAEIVDRCIIKAKPNQDSKSQLFRVYSISKPMSGVVSVSAQHISYDLSGIPVSRFKAENASSAMAGLLTNAVIDCPFTFRTDKATVAPFAVSVPGSIRSKLGGSEGSILDVYGGEYEFDNYNVVLHENRGRNRGVSIRYGKNLTDLKQDRNCASVATGIYPYWVNAENGEVVELPEKIYNVPGTYNFKRIKMFDVSGAFLEAPTAEQMRDYAKSYIGKNRIGAPQVSMSISFKQLEQSEEYKGMALLEKVSLFDTVNVEFPALGVSAMAKATKIIYNVLLERVENITLGSVKAKITDTVANQQQRISQTPTRNDVQRASAAATAWLTNGKGYKVERRDDNGNTIDTLYMDTPDIETAVNVLRIGQSGIGFSKNGVNGPYYSAWTLDGTFDAAAINVINLVAQKLLSTKGASTLKIDGATITLLSDGHGTISIENMFDGLPIVYMTNYDGGKKTASGELSPHHIKLGGVEAEAGIIMGWNIDKAKPYLVLGSGNGLDLEWKANGDGTYSLIGRGYL